MQLVCMDYTLHGVHIFIKDSYLSTSCSHTFSQRLVRRFTSASSLSKSEWGPRWVGRDFSTSRRALCTSSVSWSMTICCCDTEFWRFSKSSWTWTYTMHIWQDNKVQLWELTVSLPSYKSQGHNLSLLS